MLASHTKITEFLSSKEETALRRLSSLILFLRGELSLNELRYKLGKPLPEGLIELASSSMDGVLPKLSQQAFGERIGCTYAGVQAWEKSKKNSFPRLSFYIKIALEANLTVNELTEMLFDLSDLVNVAQKNAGDQETIQVGTSQKIQKITTLIRQFNITSLEEVTQLLNAIAESCLAAIPERENGESVFFSQPQIEKKYVDLDFETLKRLGKVFFESLKLDNISFQALINKNQIKSGTLDAIALTVEEKEQDENKVDGNWSLKIEELELNLISQLCCKIRGWITEDNEETVWLNPKKHYLDFKELLADLTKQI